MEALVMACSTGGGHISAAKAMCTAYESRGWKAVFLDPYTLSSKKLARKVGRTYVDLVQFSAPLFGDIYRLGQLYTWLEKKLNLPDPVMEIQKHVADLLHTYLKEHSFDLILCTHPYPAFMLSLLKLQGVSLPVTILAATDYTCIPLEADSLCDWMVIPAKQLLNAFVEAGFPYPRLVPTGIPVDPAFEKPLAREEACARLHLPANQRYLLMAGGSMGSSTITQTIQSVLEWMNHHPGYQLIVICGSNQELLENLKEHPRQTCIPVGFTQQMREYLGICDLYMTKPGGLSISEAAAVGVPLLLCDPIPGCESANAAFFENYGMASYARQSKDIPFLLDRFLGDTPASRRNRQEMIFCQHMELPHQTASRLVDFSMEALHLHKTSLQKSS